MSVPWWQRRMVALDVESSGVDVESDRIVTACVVFVGGSFATESLSLVADPGIEIPDDAAEIHGYTTARVRAEGAPSPEVLAAIAAALAPAADAGYPLVAMNARFDLTLVARELRRHGLDPLPPFRVVDPFVLDKHLDRFRRGSRKLDALCEHYGAALDDAHDAGSDALAAARLAWCIGARGEVVRRVRNAQDGRELAALTREWESVRGELDLLHAAQVRWAAEQAEGLEAYFTARGEPQRVERAWPLIPPPGPEDRADADRSDRRMADSAWP